LLPRGEKRDQKKGTPKKVRVFQYHQKFARHRKKRMLEKSKKREATRKKKG